jgi:hypothetical protein
MKQKIISVDFDGTLCTNAWPCIGKPNNSLITWLKHEQLKGSRIILWTCRTGDLLDWAVAWCKNRGLYFDAVNDNIPEAIEHFGSNCRKVFADIYIDDKSIPVSAELWSEQEEDLYE